MPNFLSQFRLVYMCLKNKSQRMRMKIQDICFLRFFTDISSPLLIRYLQYKYNNLFCLTSIPRYSPIGTMFPLNILLSCIDPLFGRYSPIGIMFLVCGKILDIEDPGVMMERLGLYMLTVILGLFIHAFITLSLVYFAATRKNPFIILRGVLQALVTAFGTGSRYHYSCLLFTGLKKLAESKPSS